MGSGNQTPMVERHQTRADQVLAMARRHAEEIRASAEAEAERVVLEADRETARRRDEQLEADRRERTRLAIDRRQIEESLDAVVAAVARIRELIATFPSAESQRRTEMPESSFVPLARQGDVTTSAPHAALPVPSSGDLASRRNRLMKFIAIGLGVWAIVMIGTLTLLPRTRVNAAATATAATGGTGTTAAAIADAPAEPLVVPLQVVPATGSTVAGGEAATTLSSDDQSLTVAFVAAGECWLSIATDDGTWNERVLKAAERHVVHARDVVSFKAGNAAALSILINDRPTAPLGGEGRVVTRRITRENYRSFLAS